MSSVLFLDLTSTSGQIHLNNEVPPQELTLTQVRVEFTASTDALASKFLCIDFPWLGSSGQILTNSDYKGIPILLDNAEVTVRDTNIQFKMQKNIPEIFEYRISGPSVSNLERVTLVFSHDYGALV